MIKVLQCRVRDTILLRHNSIKPKRVLMVHRNYDGLSNYGIRFFSISNSVTRVF